MRQRWIRTATVAGLAAVLGLGAAAPAALADERDFTLVNDSSRAIVDLYITHVSEPGWSDNILVSYHPPGASPPSPKPRLTSEGQSPAAFNEVIVLPWNDHEALEHTVRKHAREIADRLPPTSEDEPVVDDPEDVRSRMESALEELEAVMKDLREIAGPDEREATEEARTRPT